MFVVVVLSLRHIGAIAPPGPKMNTTHRHGRNVVGVGAEDLAFGLLSLVEAKNGEVPLLARASYALVLRQNDRVQHAVQTNRLETAG